MREKMKRQQDELAKKLQDCQSLLKEAEQFVPGRTAKRIQQYLHDSDSGYVSNDIPGEAAHDERTEKSHEAEDEQDSSGSSVGSLRAVDEVEYDVNRTHESRATGYIGKSSEITWMQRLQQETLQRNGAHEDDSNASNLFGPPEINYHLDDFDIGVSEPVQMYWVPPRPLADQLFQTYLRVTHPYFPIINRPLFCDQYERFFDSPALPGDKWMAILNMIFAISAHYAHVAELNWHNGDQDHLLYLTRARMLSMNGDEVFRHPDLQQVQVEGLMAFYLLATHQIHRSWRILGLAIRSAVSLGMNLKNNNPAITDVSKEIRNRVWWSLLVTENKLGLMTGRPTCISVNLCSSPLPLPFEENELQQQPAISLLNDSDLRDSQVNNVMASSNLRSAPFAKSSNRSTKVTSYEWLHNLPVSAGLYFLYACDLNMLVQELLDRVYTANAVHQAWKEIQNQIDDISGKIDLWLSSLPPGLDFTRMNGGDQVLDDRMRLAFPYYSARIMLGRPCMCRHDRDNPRRFSEDQLFTQAMAISTIKSAIQMAHLIPDDSTAFQSIEYLPWWCLLHYVMQTLTIMILELSFSCIHLPEEKNNLLHLSKKCIRWLDRTSRHSVASHRAWQLCDSALRRLAEPLSLDVSDLPSRPYRERPVNTNSFGVHPMDPMEGPYPTSNESLKQDYIMQDPIKEVFTTSSGTNPLFATSGSAFIPGQFAHDPISENILELFFPGAGDIDTRMSDS
ncbi:transcriptional regulator family: Fungal Specific TF [Penicillium maclennaniae]|uniref:transcriptional regulator family: Fungal Specific TF n=1 Tax=Penicillium maclennaniae TaxID=1343394 RepID=UPI002540F278|nr:transcriptional regulator family: Fungal Specific TF [Penicillium maclennaniae]KAJ5681876.1 transcriptional regulator family: Fungal Specific TF [Penicillium maclennaniae]